jgi:membrane-bound ClpP family serine protease
MISLDNALPGMVLSDAIIDQQGQVLLAQGTVLTAGTIAALGRHEVAMLPIEVAGAAAPVVDVAAVTARLAYIFRGDGAPVAGPADTATAILRHCIEDYRLGREEAA